MALSFSAHVLIIRPPQLTTFVSSTHSAFALEVIERARAAGLATTISDDEALRRVTSSIDTALRFGLLGPAQAERFAVLDLRHGEGFERQAWARAILWSARLTLDERLDQLEAWPK